MKAILSIILILLINIDSLSQIAEPPAQVKHYITITDGRNDTRILWFGVDPTATNGIDINMGESLLPPYPPLGIFEARFNLPANNFNGSESSYSDIRNGSSPFSGEVINRLAFQMGEGDSVMVYWDFPTQITAKLQTLSGSDIDLLMSGSGNFLIPEPDANNRLRFTVTYNNATDLEFENSLPEYFALSQNYPNPFNPSTKIQYSIPSNQIVQLKIYDVLGKEITTLVNKEQSAGTYEVNFDGKNLTSGIYFYTIKADNYTETKSMIFMK